MKLLVNLVSSPALSLWSDTAPTPSSNAANGHPSKIPSPGCLSLWFDAVGIFLDRVRMAIALQSDCRFTTIASGEGEGEGKVEGEGSSEGEGEDAPSDSCTLSLA